MSSRELEEASCPARHASLYEVLKLYCHGHLAAFSAGIAATGQSAAMQRAPLCACAHLSSVPDQQSSAYSMKHAGSLRVLMHL